MSENIPNNGTAKVEYSSFTKILFLKFRIKNQISKVSEYIPKKAVRIKLNSEISLTLGLPEIVNPPLLNISIKATVSANNPNTPEIKKKLSSLLKFFI